MGHSWAEAHGVSSGQPVSPRWRGGLTYLVPAPRKPHGVQRDSPTTQIVSSASLCLLTFVYLVSLTSLRARRPMTASVYARSST